MNILNQKCEACGMTMRRAILLAMLEDEGAKTWPGANYCPDTEDHEHVWSAKREVPHD